jgi:hypothetical protein
MHFGTLWAEYVRTVIRVAEKQMEASLVTFAHEGIGKKISSYHVSLLVLASFSKMACMLVLILVHLGCRPAGTSLQWVFRSPAALQPTEHRIMAHRNDAESDP